MPAPRTASEETVETFAGFPARVRRPSANSGGAENDRPPLVFVHGAFADHTCFDGWVDRAADSGFWAVAASRRGRLGVGPDRAAGLTIDDYLADTRTVLDELGRPAVLVGHSLGGILAQRLAAEGRAAAVVLLASAPPFMLNAQPVAIPHFAPNLPRILRGKPFIVPDGACSVLALNDVPEADRPAIHRGLTHESGLAYRSVMFGTERVKAADVKVPLRVIGGADDRIVGPKVTRRIAGHYGVPAEIHDGHAHWLIAEPGWESLADDVFSWVARHSSSAADR